MVQQFNEEASVQSLFRQESLQPASSSSQESCQLPVRRNTRLYERDWVQRREWICQLVSEEFTRRNQGPVPIPNSSQVRSLSTWLGRQVLFGFCLFLFWSSEFWIPFCTWPLQQSVHCSLTAFWKSGVFWLLSGMAETIWQIKKEALMGRHWILASWSRLAVV